MTKSLRLTGVAVLLASTAAYAVDAVPRGPLDPPPPAAPPPQEQMILQRPSVPGGPWTMTTKDKVKEVPDSEIGPKARELLGDDERETLVGHTDIKRRFHIDGRIQ